LQDIGLRAEIQALKRGPSVALRDRKLLACGSCGWVHYAMTFEERLENDRSLIRYHLTPSEQLIYQSAYRQCLRCESPVGGFRRAEERDLVRAAAHMVTPVMIDNG
jgi:hypothetical protein